MYTLDADLVFPREPASLFQADERQINCCHSVPHAGKKDGIAPLAFSQTKRLADRQPAGLFAQKIIRFLPIGKLLVAVTLVPHGKFRSAPVRKWISAFYYELAGSITAIRSRTILKLHSQH